MKLICMHCGRSFEGNSTKFCSQSCRDARIVALERRIREEVRNNSSHTDKLSRE